MKNPTINKEVVEKNLIQEANEKIFKPAGYILIADAQVDTLQQIYGIERLYFARWSNGQVISEYQPAQQPAQLQHTKIS